MLNIMIWHLFWRFEPTWKTFWDLATFKGQLISKCIFGLFNSPKKQTKIIRLEVLTIVVKSNFFFRFLGELKIPKRHFEINWPLVKARNSTTVISFNQVSAMLEKNRQFSLKFLIQQVFEVNRHGPTQEISMPPQPKHLLSFDFCIVYSWMKKIVKFKVFNCFCVSVLP